MFIAILIVLAVVALVWKLGPRRLSGPGFKFVYVNQDGSVRELSPGEREYLSEKYLGGDSGRPYIKSRYSSLDGWGSISGFIRRSYVPARITILPVHPDYDAREKELGFDMLDSHRAAGDVIETRADGSIVCIPNPEISSTEWFDLSRSWYLEDQRKREKLAAASDQELNDKANA